MYQSRIGDTKTKINTLLETYFYSSWHSSFFMYIYPRYCSILWFPPFCFNIFQDYLYSIGPLLSFNNSFLSFLSLRHFIYRMYWKWWKFQNQNLITDLFWTVLFRLYSSPASTPPCLNTFFYCIIKHLWRWVREWGNLYNSPVLSLFPSLSFLSLSPKISCFILQDIFPRRCPTLSLQCVTSGDWKGIRIV